MKRLIASFSPMDNPTDAARSVVDMLNSNIASIGNVVKRWNTQIRNHPDDDSLMNRLVDDSSFMQSKIDEIMTHYGLR